MSEDDFLEKYQLGIDYTAVEDLTVGETYPLYGMITKFIDDTPGSVVVEFNRHVHLKLNVVEEEKVALLKERSFETALFVCDFVSGGETPIFSCQTIIFGKKSGELH